jgi:hypothetical protein
LFRHRQANILRTDLIFPLYYLSIDGFDPSRTEDCYDPEVFSFLRSRQWIDFRALRHKNPESEDVASKIDEMADGICLALRRAGADEEKSHRETAEAHNRSRVDEDRRDEEAKKGAAAPLAYERAIQERRSRQATAEQERARTARQRVEKDPVMFLGLLGRSVRFVLTRNGGRPEEWRDMSYSRIVPNKAAVCFAAFVAYILFYGPYVTFH